MRLEAEVMMDDEFTDELGAEELICWKNGERFVEVSYLENWKHNCFSDVKKKPFDIPTKT
jgi:hypothetical protein